MPCWCSAWAMRPARSRSRRAGSWRLWSARSSGCSSTSRSHLQWQPGTRVAPSRPSPRRSRRCCRRRPRRWRAARFRATSPRSGWRTPADSLAMHPAWTGSLAHAEQSRRLNLRALRHPPQGGLRSSLDALEHTSISMRTLFRAVHDATQRRTGVQDDPDYATHVRCSAAVLMADMATVLWAFGRCAHGRAAGTAEQQHVELASALASLRRRRDGLERRTHRGPAHPAGTVGTQLRTADHRRPDAAGARRRHDHRRPRPAAHEAGARQAARGRPRRHPPTRLARRIRPRTARIDRTPVTRSPPIKRLLVPLNGSGGCRPCVNHHRAASLRVCDPHCAELQRGRRKRDRSPGHC